MVHATRQPPMLIKKKRLSDFRYDNAGDTYISLLISLIIIVFVAAMILMIFPIFKLQSDLSQEARTIARVVETDGYLPTYNDIEAMFSDSGNNAFIGTSVTIRYAQADESGDIVENPDFNEYTISKTNPGTRIQMNLRWPFTIIVRKDVSMLMLFGDNEHLMVSLKAGARGICEVFFKYD